MSIGAVGGPRVPLVPLPAPATPAAGRDDGDGDVDAAASAAEVMEQTKAVTAALAQRLDVTV